MVIERLSGIAYNQNQPPSNLDGINDWVSLADWKIQEFRLPENFVRGSGEQKIPALTGFQFFVDVPEGAEDTATLEWVLDIQRPGIGWQSLVSGATTGTYISGTEVWFDAFFNKPVELSLDDANRFFRFKIRGTDVDHIWYSIPNPLDYTGVAAYDSDETTILYDPESGNKAAFLFRLLAASADAGTDFLGNSYRSAVLENKPEDVEAGVGNYWLSKPNPSKFAVECLYFDVSSNDEATVVDRILVDPVTPGMYFHVYFSNDGSPGTSDNDWEDRLWTPVTKSFQATKRETHVLPAPITAKYICIEFSHLQARSYDPGDFHQPIRYKKHPKWVLDYFLLQTVRLTEDHFIPRQVTILYDALDLAYNYYVDDLLDKPDDPASFSETEKLHDFLTDRSDLSDKVDPDTLARIETRLAPWRNQPGLRGPLDYLPSSYTTAVASTRETDYPTEAPVVTPITTVDVSTTDRDAVVFEQSYPVMYFFVESRHFYRQVEAEFEYHRAYFAGVKEVTFLRDNYAIAHDNDLYIETAGDEVNVWRNDFVRFGNSWTVYDPTLG
jgi:hypothetical protein